MTLRIRLPRAQGPTSSTCSASASSETPTPVHTPRSAGRVNRNSHPEPILLPSPTIVSGRGEAARGAIRAQLLGGCHPATRRRRSEADGRDDSELAQPLYCSFGTSTEVLVRARARGTARTGVRGRRAGSSSRRAVFASVSFSWSSISSVSSSSKVHSLPSSNDASQWTRPQPPRSASALLTCGGHRVCGCTSSKIE